jgi:hypothetical protein
MEWLRPDQPGRRLQRRDVIIQVTDDIEWTFPPAVVDSDAIAIPRTRRAVAHLLRTESTWIIPLQDTEKILVDHGHPNPELRTDHHIVSPQHACRPAPTRKPVTPVAHSQSDHTQRGRAGTGNAVPPRVRSVLHLRRSDRNPHDVNDIHPGFRGVDRDGALRPAREPTARWDPARQPQTPHPLRRGELRGRVI